MATHHAIGVSFSPADGLTFQVSNYNTCQVLGNTGGGVKCAVIVRGGGDLTLANTTEVSSLSDIILSLWGDENGGSIMS